jgi:hypothetical protein
MALVAVGPLKVTVGAVVYPEPALSMTTDTTVAVRAVDSVEVAAAGVLGVPPPVNDTVGAVA